MSRLFSIILIYRLSSTLLSKFWCNILLFLLSSFPLILLSQENLSGEFSNLVPNHSFEELIGCPKIDSTETERQLKGSMRFAPPWFSAATNSGGRVFAPCNGLPRTGFYQRDSYQLPRSGDAIAHIQVYRNVGGRPYSGYIGVKLREPLQPGSTYYGEFFVSVDANHEPIPLDTSNQFFAEWNWAYTNKVGMAVSQDSVQKKLAAFEVLDFDPVIEHNTLITDTVGWTKVSGSFTVDSIYKFIIIGNFSDIDNTQAEIFDPKFQPYLVHHYLDDITLFEFNPLPDSIILCENESITLKGLSGSMVSNAWSTGELTDSIITTDSGMIYLTTNIGTTRLVDSVKIIQLSSQTNMTIVDTALCEGASMELKLDNPIGHVEWTGNYIKQIHDSSAIVVDQSGQYSARITNSCGVTKHEYNVSDKNCNCNIYVPNAFSPNADATNDSFKIFPSCNINIDEFQFRVFNKLGSLVYASENPYDVAWDGRTDGGKYFSGVYIWKLSYRTQLKEIERFGTLILTN